MNSLLVANKKCEVCLRKGLETKVRTICDECREFLCKECSDTHLLHRLSMNHRLIDLDPPGVDTRSANEDELASDFLEKATISETTVLYRAQVAVENGSLIKKQEEHEKTVVVKPKGKIDISKLKATKCQEFCAKRSDDREGVLVRGLLVLVGKVVVVDRKNKKLKLFDSSGNYLSSTDLIDSYTTGITLIDKDLFATCGSYSKVYLWTLRGDTIVSEDVAYDVDHRADGIHYNGTYYCVLHGSNFAVTILDRQGRRIRKIVMKEAFGKEIEFGFDIHMDSDTHNIYIPCLCGYSGVLCMSVEGEALWITPLPNVGLLRRFLGMPDADSWGITEIHDTLCVADRKNKCLHLISKTGEYKGKLLEKKVLQGKPLYICYDEHENKLYVSFLENDNDDKRGKISVFILQ